MGLRINRRIGLGKGASLNLGKRGVSVTKRGMRGSVGFGRAGGRGSVRIMRGVSWLFGKRG